MNMLLDITGLSPEALITLAAGSIAFVTVYVIWQSLLERDPLSSRARSLGKYRDVLKNDLMRQKGNRFQRRETVTFMRSVITRLDLLKGAHVAKIADRLAQCGWRDKDAIVIFLFFKLCLPFVVGGVSLVGIYGLADIDMAPVFKILIALVGVIIGAYLPEIFVSNAAQKRRNEMLKGLPDALDLMVICTEAGLALDAALTRVSRELSKSSPELADEFGLTAVELGFQPERRIALKNLIKRTDMPTIRGVVNTLIQTEKYGTPLAQSLRVLAAEYRDERMLKAEEKAAKLPATLTVPLIVFIMPSLFVVLLGPAILRAIDGLSSL